MHGLASGLEKSSSLSNLEVFMRVFVATTQSVIRVAILVLTATGCAGEWSEARQVLAREPAAVESAPEQQSTPLPSVTGKVVAVKDGDTIVVLKDQEQITVRLEGIDCPESGQAFGSNAKQAASDSCFGKHVTLNVTGEDRYGRTLADVILPDGSSVNRELVRAGYARWFRKYSADVLSGELGVVPLEDADAYAAAKPVRDDGTVTFDEQKIEARQDAQVRLLLDKEPFAVIVLGGDNDLSDNVKRLSDGKAEYLRVEVEAWKRVAGEVE